MRRHILTAVALALGLTLTVAGPASADHVGDVLEMDGVTYCRMGALPSGIGVDLWTTDFRLDRDRAGEATRLRCTFDVPDRVLPEESPWGIGWTLPGRAYVVRGFECWSTDTHGPDLVYATWDTQFVVTPNGRATMTCRF